MMKKRMRFAALLAAAGMLLGSMPVLPVSAEADSPPFYYFGTADAASFQDWTQLIDKGMMREAAAAALKGMGANENTPYYLYTCHDTGKKGYSDPSEYMRNDPVYLFVPQEDCLRFVLRDDIDKTAAQTQASAIVKRYFADTEPYFAAGCCDVAVEDAAMRTAENAEKLMRDLDAAGLISAFYPWGQIFRYIWIEHEYLTAYYPNNWAWKDHDCDWEAVKAWVKEKHPECVIACITDMDSELAKRLAIDKSRFAKSAETVYAVIPPADTAFADHFALAAELYAAFGLCANAYPTPEESEAETAFGKNALVKDTESQDSDTLSQFRARIAGWDDAKLEECYVLDNLLLTPKKAYDIQKLRYSPYRIYLKDGAKLTGAEILAKWKEMLLAEGYPQKTLDTFTECTLTESEGGYLVETDAQEGYKGIDLLGCLRTFPQVQRVEAQFGYHTDSRPNSQSGYQFSFRSYKEPTPADFPELENVVIRNTYVEGSAPIDRWYLSINPQASLTNYADYFAAVPYMQSLDYVTDLRLCFMETEVGDCNEDAKIIEPYFTVLFDRGGVQNTAQSKSMQAYFERIAGWENTTLDDCYILNGTQLLTPEKPYSVAYRQCSPYCFYLKRGTKPDADAIRKKWREMMIAAGYPDDSRLDNEIGKMRFEFSQGGYLIQDARTEFASASIIDCLQSFPNVERVTAQFCYTTDDRVNGSGSYQFYFTSDRALTKADFPQLSVKEMAQQLVNIVPGEEQPTLYSLRLSSERYQDYYAAVPYLLSLDFISDLKLGYMLTALADLNDDTQMKLPDWDTLYRRGDATGDDTVDISDAVSVARFCAEDAAVTLNSLRNADCDNDGNVAFSDVTAILKQIAKLDDHAVHFTVAGSEIDMSSKREKNNSCVMFTPEQLAQCPVQPPHEYTAEFFEDHVLVFANVEFGSCNGITPDIKGIRYDDNTIAIIADREAAFCEALEWWYVFLELDKADLPDADENVRLYADILEHSGEYTMKNGHIVS